MPAIIIVNNKLKRLITNQVALRVNDSKETSSIWTEVAEQLTADYCKIDELKVKEIFFKEILPSLDERNYGVTEKTTLQNMKKLVKPISKSPQPEERIRSTKRKSNNTLNENIEGDLRPSVNETSEPSVQLHSLTIETSLNQTRISTLIETLKKKLELKFQRNSISADHNSAQKQYSLSDLMRVIGHGSYEDAITIIDSDEEENAMETDVPENKNYEMQQSQSDPPCVEQTTPPETIESVLSSLKTVSTIEKRKYIRSTQEVEDTEDTSTQNWKLDNNIFSCSTPRKAAAASTNEPGNVMTVEELIACMHANR